MVARYSETVLHAGHHDHGLLLRDSIDDFAVGCMSSRMLFHSTEEL